MAAYVVSLDLKAFFVYPACSNDAKRFLQTTGKVHEEEPYSRICIYFNKDPVLNKEDMLVSTDIEARTLAERLTQYPSSEYSLCFLVFYRTPINGESVVAPGSHLVTEVKNYLLPTGDKERPLCQIQLWAVPKATCGKLSMKVQLAKGRTMCIYSLGCPDNATMQITAPPKKKKKKGESKTGDTPSADSPGRQQAA